MSLNRKAWSIVGLLWIALIVLVVMNAIMTRSSMLDERRSELAQQTQIAMGVIGSYQKKVGTKELTVDDAKRAAIAALRDVRYGADRSGYFGVYDSSLIALLVPPKPELESKDQSGMVDANGTHIAVEIVKSSSPGGNHLSAYVWPKPGHDAPVAKITYSDAVPEWDWHVFTGAYVDDIDDMFYGALVRNLVLVVVIGACVTLGMLWLIRSIRTSLGGEPDLAADLCRQIAAGDLTTKVEPRSGDSGSLLYAMGQMQRQLVDTVRRIQASAESITTGTNEIAAGNMDLSSRTEQQAASLEETAASMAELTSTVKQNTENARQGTTLAQSASEIAARGGDVVRRVVETMHDISGTSERVEQIIGVIDGIAFQTNILALNAAVEAARAGEQGRGFAVVASEVRSLAQRSASAAKEIKDLIGQSVAQVNEGSRLVDEAGATIDEVVKSARRVADLMGEIASASEEQHTGIEQVNQAVSQMDAVTQQNAALVEEASAAAQSMAAQSNGLREVVATFRLGADGARSAAANAATAAGRGGASSAPRPAVRRTEPTIAAGASAASAKPAAPAKPVRTKPVASAAAAAKPAASAAPAQTASSEDWETF
ncbi:methyl-accepting chemotaxis protein [Paraburkholderia caballeronis]|uniref:Methyl-accepting chemotaxis sensory transducer with Cache sensor n=1 Tax=Paraburkholderia caballeronis TaxID=416943 RepID=A0A1H7MZ04_9BURK|nr:methyl-accepting chemotaxis protein [Paraburkholderia caballeronis]PXW26350.1 methyl-accepting chemotaxis sensory transducer with Cache sensor [Paraburkholderia caballeronis]PXX01897.1 methyl-accepting chemotaxis sensory transducer with Cache sensor [Paraburkholderia caballeronis]RAK01054.1 methyl-accepting chemotaxis sensory transducer with Cache sensor [Paraburkholderia caballeronis]SEC00638.1 methyl-accepting chemotaxis sensory transducer with Cache sensor [Paraburkholderia caballeronis]